MLGLLPILAAGLAASVLRAAHSEGAVGDGWFLTGLGIALVTMVAGVGVLKFQERVIVRDGNLTLVDWLGRAKTVPCADVRLASLVSVRQIATSGPRIRVIVERVSPAPPLMMIGTALNRERTRRLFERTGIPVRVVGRTVRSAQLPESFPGLQLGLNDRRPALAGFLGAAAISVVLMAILTPLVVFL
ncbi:hypothetical protein ND748_09500 [Frankia sp. AiPs1]|uniref:hypothetical protein n=1 Tax=Frankia sp. AiPs1 TaxID=573493 RepID=UPI0020432026|nr:hypothetical protein [Frankia sp. AiPs1]MCM3921891.1 hypothetical protein [Frankia sp. AiPs1]